jgi:predicted acetyltransferase
MRHHRYAGLMTHGSRSDVTLRPFSREEFDAASGVVELAFFFSGHPEDREVFAAGLEFDRSLGAFVDVPGAAGDRIVGTAAAYTFELTVPGSTTPAAGVTVVTVHPTHRRRGVLSAMMDRQLADLHERGEPIAVLRASEAGIYGRFGYAMASRELHLDFTRPAALFVPDAPRADGLVVELDEPGSVRAELAGVYDALRPSRPGFIGRRETAWAELLHDPEHRRGGAGAARALLVRDGAGPRGYALYTVQQRWSDGLPTGHVDVREMIATDTAAALALWRHVLDLDLTATAGAGGRPVDDPLLQLLADPRRARARVKDGLWLRLVRVGEALAARRYAAPVDLVLDVTDARCPWNARRWRLSGDADGATCEPSTERADVRIDTTALAAGYLGDPVLGGYLGTGRIGDERPGAVRQLATALGWTPGPWCPHHF